MSQPSTVREAARDANVVANTDVVVVGGGPAGLSAAVAAARNGAKVTLLERYPYLGGLASGGMVLVLDDMHNGLEISVRGIAMEIIERMAKWDLAVFPPKATVERKSAALKRCGANGLAGASSIFTPKPSPTR